MEARALRRRGWSLSATAGHLGRDRKTVRAYLRGDQEAGVRHFVAPDRLVPFVPYLRARFADRLAPAGSGAVVRTPEQTAALEKVVLAQFTSKAPCDRKGNYPPSATAQAEAKRLLAGLGPEVTVDLDVYDQLVAGEYQ